MAEETKWTPQQQRAIDLRNKNILVSAAAGSGKTAVLVERIKKLILEENVPIDQMLIVTFTKAAASEMKEKIRKAIIKEIDNNPESAQLLRRQLALLSKANISTFHSFALDVLRRFFHMSDINPGFKICDEAQGTILREEAMDKLLEESFDTLTPEFTRFLDWYSSERNYTKIREQIIGAYTSLQAMPYPWKWLEDAISDIGKNGEEFKNTKAYEFYCKYIQEQAKFAYEACNDACHVLVDAELERLANKISENDLVFYEEFMNAVICNDIEKAKLLCNGYRATSLRAAKDEKETYEEIKNTVKELRDQAKAAVDEISDLMLSTSLEEHLELTEKTKEVAEEFARLLMRFDELFKAAKAEKHLIDFNDIEHYCLEILENEQACQYYRDKFNYIFIDEYQDTNVLQEEIISRIKKANNLFMVGDIKQSIYKFRLAEPEIFNQKYSEYAEIAQEPDGLCEKIDLNMNFRSTPVILDEINHIFGDIMEGYDDAAKLYPGREEGDNKRPSIRVIDLQESREADELTELKNTEIEALKVANIIRGVVGKPFFDHKAGVTRPINLSDIVILMRGIKNYAGVFSQVLKTCGIDSYVDENEGYFDTIEINVFMNLLSIIDNKKQDVPLISVLRSEIFDFTSLELATIRTIDKRCSFEEAFCKYAEEGELPLAQKCKSALDSINHFRNMAGSMPLGKFVWTLMLETDYYIRCGAMPAGRQRQANLRALVEKAENYESMRQGSLFSFVRYIDAIKSRKVPMGQVKLLGEGDDLVRIMTIHKSKGLEFPVVILSGMGRKCNYSTTSVGASIHKDIGIGFTYVNKREHWYKHTLVQKLINLKVRQEEVAEEKRILYVAMTRAKDFLFMTGTVKDSKAYEKLVTREYPGTENYLSMSCKAREIGYFAASAPNEHEEEAIRFYGNPMDWNIYERETAESREKAEEAIRRLSYEYPYEKETFAKSKYSVSELFHEERASSVKMMHMASFGDKVHKMTAAEKGNVYHTIMEHIDFHAAVKGGISYIEEACCELVSKEILMQEEIDAIKLENIAGFFASDLGVRCAEKAKCGKLNREKPFTMEFEDAEKGLILVQGIIDCYFEDEDGLVIVDYKSNWIDESLAFEAEADRIRNIYKGQLDLYSKALESATGLATKERYLFLLAAGKSITV